ncbi:MAG TPA: isochorismatase family cysteine hydrolase [Candidatus Dojkabacteria bacterium]|nr:isochorismatase family cysteine hydrolase [Candidatus Dojkabacteria bacterium]
MKNKDLNQYRKLLVVVDMNKGFVEKGALADPNIGQIVPAITQLIDKFLTAGGRVIYANDAHNENSEEFKNYPVHCLDKTEEAEPIDALKGYVERGEATICKKDSTNAMESDEFCKELQKIESNLDEIVIVGCCTDICVLHLALSLQDYLDERKSETKLIVPENAVDTFRGEVNGKNREERSHEALEWMKGAGVIVVPEYKQETDIDNEWEESYPLS